jgi:N-acetylglucosamine-6-sulfatase
MAVDESLGMLMKELEDRGDLDNTIVVFASDHGYWYGEHGLDAERRLAYEEAIRIPLLIRYPPAIQAGSKPEQMALSIDLAPTLLELAGQQLGAHLQGRSLAPIFKGAVSDWRTSFLIEYYSDTVFLRIVNMGYKAVRGDRYKYIHYLELEGMDELYDLQEDPYEFKNIINDPGSTQVLEQMKQELGKRLSETE